MIIKNQANPTGHRMLIERSDGIVSEYAHVDNYDRAKRFDARLRSEIEWIEKFTSHAPSIGTHYEKILSDLVSEYLPNKISVGTGFVYDSFRETSSPQIDLLCYSNQLISPIHQRDDFVIIQPDMVLAVCEVKKTLTTSDLKYLIRKTIGCNMGTGITQPIGVQKMHIFSYNCQTRTKTIVQNVAEAIKDFLKSFIIKSKDGGSDFYAIRNMCLPSIYMHDRNECIIVSIERQSSSSIEGKIKIITLETAGVNGVSPFLGSLSEIANDHISDKRDHCSSFLQLIKDEMQLDIPVFLFSYMSSLELIEVFPESKEILKNNRAYGVYFSSFDNPKKHETFDSFSSMEGFSWCIDDYAKQKK